MLNNKKTKTEQGFTQIEILSVSLLIGMVAAMGVPSLMTQYQNTQIKATANKIQTILLDAQRQAMRRGSSCKLNFEKNSQEHISKITSEEASCLLIDDDIIPDEIIVTSTELNNISFSFRGNADNSGLIIVSTANSSADQKCLQISSNLGMVKQGTYENSNCNLPF